ncbi:hypothetical protein TSUD_362660 [Trifolium subterraneum]|uniref:Response regulatory domain-containing protein n=1 Tax=Trifolium subterraneum TaxID=3900 RepID=A0A2Z6N965_TRISU|nr:hypothetical protein TSUD_362660 [Trifolium subterraneum]
MLANTLQHWIKLIAAALQRYSISISISIINIPAQVATATLASEALYITGDKKNEINLVVVEAQLPDMEIYELVEKIKSSNIPSFILTAHDDDTSSISKKHRVHELNGVLENRTGSDF